MAAGTSGGGRAIKGKPCCSALDAALTGEDFEPCFTVDDDGVLCVAIGITDIDEDEPTLILEPVIFCPFCGTKLQAGGDTPAGADDKRD